VNRRSFVTGLGAFLAAPLAADAQHTGKVYHVGWLRYMPCQERGPSGDLLQQGLRERGYVEGRDVVIECRSAAAGREHLSDFATELVRLKVDVLVTEGTLVALAAKRATTTIPIVIQGVSDPVGSGLTASLARPGGNITGLSIVGADLVSKALALLKEAVPTASRVALLTDRTNPGQTSADDRVDAVSKALRVDVQRTPVRNRADLDGVFASVLDQRAQALLMFALPLSETDMRRIADFAIKNRLATMSILTPAVDVGMLTFFGPNLAEQYRHVGIYVDKILKGAKPADLPVEQPTKFELVINLKTARALGLTIQPSLLLRADQVIE